LIWSRTGFDFISEVGAHLMTSVITRLDRQFQNGCYSSDCF